MEIRNMKYRERKKNDNEKTQEAFELLLELIEKNQKEIEPALWVGAMICALSENYQKGGIPFEYFKKEMMDAIQHYKY